MPNLLEDRPLTRKDLQLGSQWSTKTREAKTVQVIRTIARLRGSWAMVARVERKDYSGNKHDLYGVFDLLVTYPDRIVGVQVCGNDWKKHIHLYQGERLQNALRWLSDPHREFQMWGWRKLKRRNYIWIPRVQNITAEFLRGEADPQMMPEISDIFDPGK